MEKYSVKRNIVKALLCATAAALCFLMFCGCSSAPRLRFTVDEIFIYVGESRDLAPYAVFEPSTAGDRDFTLKADGDCVRTVGTTVIGRSGGTATVTASNGEHTAKIKITVSYRAAQTVTLKADGDTVQTVGDLRPVKFTASLDDFADPSSEIVFSVNGERASSGGEYVFEPRAAGEYTVRATAENISASQTVTVYNATAAEGHSDGELTQHRNFSPVRFYVSENTNVDNPASKYRWTVNGETKSTRAEFSYAPLSAGEYEIGLFVNGVKRNIDGREHAVITAVGDRAPFGRVLFDDLDGVFVVFDDGGIASSVSITDGVSGVRRIYSSSDSRYSHLFGGGYFDASEFISPCSAIPRTYTVAVIADAAGEPFSFEQYPSAAEKYVTQKVVCKNSFLSDGAQAAEWLNELFAKGALSAQGYLSREAAENTDEILNAIAGAAKALGVSVTASADGSILTVELEPYVNYPTVTQSSALRRTRAGELHFETVSSTRLRAKDYKLAIERARSSVRVENSEQLLAAVKNGVRPEPANGTAAKHVYSSARAILLAIVGKDYTAAQKVHAMYDWLQFCTLRIDNTVAGGVSDYVEGVFGDGRSTPPLAVSDMGAAKALALLCGMEGIDCKILCADGDYYNKALIDGLWYNVDVYGGEVRIDGTNNERCSHAGLFYADGEPSDASSAYDASLAPCLQKHWSNGVYFDYYISGTDDKKTVDAAVGYAFSAQSRKSYEIVMPSGVVQYVNTDYGAEFVLSGGLNAAGREQAISLIRAAAENFVAERVKKSYDGDDLQERTEYYVGTVRVVQSGDTVFVTAQIPYFPSV